MLVLTIASETPGGSDNDAAYASFLAALLRQLPADWSVVECQVDARAEVSCVPAGRVLRGGDSFWARLGGFDFDVPYDAFFQPNARAFDLLLEWCRGQLAPLFRERSSLTVADLYCGVGALGRILGAGLGIERVHLFGFESGGSAIERAPRNVAGLEGQARFQALDLNESHPGLFATQADLVILDPPRAGLSPALKKALLHDCKASHVLYISCNPRSQLGDLEALAPAYAPRAACIVDCFPHTGHLEQAVVLERCS